MLKVDISDGEIDKLHELHLHPHPVVRRRALILLLKSQNVAHHKIALIANVCENTVRQCLQDFLCAGITQLYLARAQTEGFLVDRNASAKV